MELSLRCAAASGWLELAVVSQIGPDEAPSLVGVLHRQHLAALGEDDAAVLCGAIHARDAAHFAR